MYEDGTEKCPICDSFNISIEDMTDYYGYNIITIVKCYDCRSQWENEYKFVRTNVSRPVKPKEDDGMDDDALKRLGVL